MQNVSVQDGGKAIVGNVTQHARVLVSDKGPSPAVKVSMPDPGVQEHDPMDAKRGAKAGVKA